MTLHALSIAVYLAGAGWLQWDLLAEIQSGRKIIGGYCGY